ncbi:MAG: SDR family NAD(P)-dependent oxidoreductase [Dehalococcoidia bacterium]|nr:SDR family NAD(P)-dependent oxidoreductase [Dehalococcoidia bacterium]
MKEFEGKVAVVTGAASGIGLAMARRFAQAGASVVMADVEREALTIAASEIETITSSVLSVQTNVSSASEIESLANQTLERFGAVHILCNNAGVSGQETKIWEATANDWDWIVGVNQMSVAHGIRVFVPIMLEQGTEAHVVNTSSVLGIASPGRPAIYGTTKHAVTLMSEALHHQLQEINSKIKVSVLCPGMINTRITDGERNRPSDLQNPLSDQERSTQQKQRSESLARFNESGMPPEEVAEMVFEAIQAEKFYILTHPSIKESVEERMQDILQERVPVQKPLSL